MENRLILNKVLTEITINWPRTSGGDPNTIDVLVYARIVVEIASVELPLDLPEKEAGRRIVEVVEKEFISSSSAIRVEVSKSMAPTTAVT